MARDAIEFHLRLFECALDLFDAFEQLAALKHVVGRLSPLRARFPGVSQEIRKIFRAMLGSFDAWMKTVLCHRSCVF